MGQIGPIGRLLIRLRPPAPMRSFFAVLHSSVMTNQSFASDIRRYAIAGAQARLDEITQELEAIRRAFPELRQNGPSGASTGQSAVTGGDEPATRSRRRRSTMSAAQRKVVGERMKKYWAARRGGGQTVSASDSPETAAPARASRLANAGGTAKRGPRTMSPEARKRISDAQKARWAKQRGETNTAETSSAGGPPAAAKGRRTAKRSVKGAAKRGPRKMSAAARKRISQAQKKRWAAKRKAA
jgi:hypothetical protein